MSDTTGLRAPHGPGHAHSAPLNGLIAARRYFNPPSALPPNPTAAFTPRTGHTSPTDSTSWRPYTRPLRGAVITGFTGSPESGYQLEYTLRGKTHRIDYHLREDRGVEFSFVDPDGTARTESYRVAQIPTKMGFSSSNLWARVDDARSWSEKTCEALIAWFENVAHGVGYSKPSKSPARD